MLLFHLQPFPLQPGYSFNKLGHPHGKPTMQGRKLLSSGLKWRIQISDYPQQKFLSSVSNLSSLTFSF